MDRDVELSGMERTDTDKPGLAARAPERIAMLYRRMMAARGHERGPALDLPDLAGCYDTDL